MYWASNVVQCIKLPLVIPAFHIRMLVLVLAAPFLIQEPVNVPGKSVEDGPLAPKYEVEFLDPGISLVQPSCCGH